MRRMLRVFVLFLLVASVALGVLPASAAVSQFGCHAQQAVAIEGAIPSTECTFIVACPFNADQCNVAGFSLDVHGIGQVEGSMSFTNFAFGVVPFTCAGTFRCSHLDDISTIFLQPQRSGMVRCAANGLAALIGVTCTVTMYTFS